MTNPLLKKLKTKGFKWLLQRSAEKSKLFVEKNSWKIFDDFYFEARKQKKVLYAFYDLSLCPVTYDILTFLVTAELERIKRRASDLHLVIVPAPGEGFRTDYQHYGSLENNSWRLRQIVIPSIAFLPTCKGLTLCSDRQEAQVLLSSLPKKVFPKNYTVRFPSHNYSLKPITDAFNRGEAIPSLKVPKRALDYVSNWLKHHAQQRKVITVSLRESAYENERNSHLDAWGKFAHRLDSSLYCPVFVRDTSQALEPLPSELENLCIFREASWNIELRAALYELSYLNLSVTSGPVHTLCMLNEKTRYIMYKPLSEFHLEDYWNYINLPPGTDSPFNYPFQKIIWEEDTLSVIEKSFKAMIDLIESSPP